MNIDKERFKRIILEQVDHLQTLETRLLAYESLCAAQVAAGLLSTEEVAFALSSPNPHAMMKKKYDALREKLSESIDKASRDQDLLKSLQQWKPEGRSN